jgi:hypothetical protein
VHQKISTLCLIVAFAFTLNGCSSMNMSAQARRERAYRHYVEKHSKMRQREIARAQKAANRQLKAKMKFAQPSEPKITTSVESSPGAWSEPTSDAVAAPVTVSASDAGAMPASYQPSRP